MPSRLSTETREAVAPLLLLALKSAEVGVAVKTDAGRYLYLAGLPHYFPALDPFDCTDAALFGDDWLPQIEQAEAEVLASGEKQALELVRTTHDQYCACECTLQRYDTASGLHAVLMTFIDLTPERKRQDTLKALLREVSHRSKNLLAIVQSIAAQTARTNDHIDTFMVKFRGRIAALSAAQDLVTDSNWQGAYFRDLVNRQFQRFLEPADPRIHIKGNDILLSPNGATHVGLALHELIANAVSHGALSHSDGEVTLTCGPCAENPTMLEILWRERFGPSRSGSSAQMIENNEKRFGSTVLERVVPAAIGGEAEYQLTTDGIDYRLCFGAG